MIKQDKIITFIKTYRFSEINLLVSLVFLIIPIFVFPHYISPILVPRFYLWLVIAVISIVAISNKLYKLNINTILIILFLCLVALSCLFAYDKESSWLGIQKLVGFTVTYNNDNLLYIKNVYYCMGFVSYVICFIMYILGTKTTKPVKLLNYLLLSTILVSIISILQFFNYDLLKWSISAPVSGTMGNPNFLASLMVFVLPGSVMLYIFSNKLVYLITSGIIFGGLLVSNTRGAWLTFFCIYFLIIIYLIKSEVQKKITKLISLCITFTLVLSLLLPINNWQLFNRGSSIKVEISNSIQLNNNGGSYRIYIYKEVIKVIKYKWLFGIGPDNLIYKRIVLPNKSLVAKAHSNILEIAVTMGIPALIIYLLFILSIFLRYKKGNRQQLIYLIMILSYMLQGLVNIDMIMIYPLFWIVLGLSVAASEENFVCKQRIKSESLIVEA